MQCFHCPVTSPVISPNIFLAQYSLTRSPIFCQDIATVFQAARLTARHSLTRATATHQLFLRRLPVLSHDCPRSFAKTKQIVEVLESSGPFAECKKDPTAPYAFETYATLEYIATQGPILRTHCGLHTVCCEPLVGSQARERQNFVTNYRHFLPYVKI
jgi:hypothetical protein